MTAERDRTGRIPPITHRRRFVGVLAVVIVGATTTGCAVTGPESSTVPSAARTMDVYTVVDSISTVVPAADRPGAIGRFIGMCDADTHYVEVDGTGWCVVLNGPLGTARATGTGHGVELDAAQAVGIRDLVRREDRGAAEPTTRVMLGDDGDWAAMVTVADLNAGGPVRGSAVD